MLAIILIPLPADDLYLRFHIREGAVYGYRIYYATQADPNFSDAQYVDSSYDERTGNITFKFDASYEGTITGVRLDYPPADDMIVIDGVSVNSGGTVKKRISVPDLFYPENYLMVNGMNLDTIASRETVCATTTGDDPFVVFGPEGVNTLSTGFSHKWSTKLCIALLIALASVFYSKDLFGRKASEDIKS